MNIPENLKCTESHEWIADNAGGTVTVGITAVATEQLGDPVCVAASDVYALVPARSWTRTPSSALHLAFDAEGDHARLCEFGVAGRLEALRRSAGCASSGASHEAALRSQALQEIAAPRGGPSSWQPATPEMLPFRCNNCSVCSTVRTAQRCALQITL